VRCRGGVTVGLEWDMPDGALTAELTAGVAGEITLGVPGRIRSVEADHSAATIELSDFGNAYREVSLPAGETVTLTIQM
jgi:hypothetical protein